MYSINKLEQISNDLKAKYSGISLDNEYKSELFNSHLNMGLTNLSRAAEILGPEEPDIDEIPEVPNSNLTLLILSVFFIILFYMVGK